MPVISENGRDNYITLDLGENKSVTRLYISAKTGFF